MSFPPPALEVCQENACFAEKETSAIAILPSTRGAARYDAEYGQRKAGLVEIALHVLNRKVVGLNLAVHLGR